MKVKKPKERPSAKSRKLDESRKKQLANSIFGTETFRAIKNFATKACKRIVKCSKKVCFYCSKAHKLIDCNKTDCVIFCAN